MAIGLTSDEAFSYAVNIVLKHEGGFSDNPSDPGGATNFGISLRLLNDLNLDLNHDGVIDINDIKELTIEAAQEIYKETWWDKYHYGLINDLGIATKIFDMSVNMGPNKAHTIAQKSCNELGFKLAQDGIIGPLTLDTINELCLDGRKDDLMFELCENQKNFYEALIERNPVLEVFERGWMARAASQGT